MSRGVAIAALIIITVALVLALVAVFTPYWEATDPSTTTNDNIVRHLGLWLQCTTYNTGNWECDNYNTFFAALPTKLQAARGLGISALVLGLASLAFSINASCESVCKPMLAVNYVFALSGIAALLAGVCIIAAAAWYATDIYEDYFFDLQRAGGNIQNAGRLMVFGSALFVAWASGGAFIFGAIVAFAAACCTSDDTRQPYTYTTDKVNTVSKTMTEYV